MENETENCRVLALDIGDRRIGVAVSDPLGVIAQPVGMIERTGWGPDIRKVREHSEQYRTKRIVCGMPLNMDGSSGAQAEKATAFAEQLSAAGFDVIFWDERLTTVAAERVLIEGGVRRADRKRVIDQTAATIILQSYLDARTG